MWDTEKYLQYCQNTGEKLKPKVLSQLSDNDKKYSFIGIIHNLTSGNSSSWIWKHWFKLIISIWVLFLFWCVWRKILKADHTDANVSKNWLTISTDNKITISWDQSSMSWNIDYINNATWNSSINLPLK